MAFLIAFALPTQTEDWICEQEACPAYIGEEGNLRRVWFREGDIISSEGGWIVFYGDGWDEDDRPTPFERIPSLVGLDRVD